MLTISIGQQKVVQCRLRHVRSAGCVFAGLDLEWHGKSSLALVVLYKHLYGGVDVAFQSVHGRPYMLLHVQELVDAHDGLFPVSFANKRVAFWSRSNKRLGPRL